MQIPIQKFGQNSIVFQKPGFLSENIAELQLPWSSIFLLKLLTRLLLNNAYKRVVGIFF